MSHSSTLACMERRSNCDFSSVLFLSTQIFGLIIQSFFVLFLSRLSIVLGPEKQQRATTVPSHMQGPPAQHNLGINNTANAHLQPFQPNPKFGPLQSRQQKPPRMTLSTETRTTFGTSEIENENKDPFVVTPPRKRDLTKETTSPATPKSKSTPLHKRFLEEVTMSPGTLSTPPRTPSKSPKRGHTSKQMLEVGQNGFYFSMEIPKKKITPRRAATPDGRTFGGQSPSPLKEKKSEVKGGETPGGGRVKDILRKNLFGTPMKKATKFGRGDQEKGDVEKTGTAVRISPSKDRSWQSMLKREPQPSEHSGSESAQNGTTTEAATEHAVAPAITQDSSRSAEPSAPPPSTMTPSTMQNPVMPPDQQQTAPALDLQKASAASTPSNIGHLMAGLRNKSSKVQMLPTTGGLESMPTPLRKMSERLGLRSPHVVRKGKVDGDGDGKSSPAAMSKTETLRLPISALDLRSAAKRENGSASGTSAVVGATTTAQMASKEGHAMRKEDPLAQFRKYPTAVASPVVSSRPSTATSSSFAFPSTSSRPGLPNRSKSFGTPTRLRFSIQEDMYKVQESLKRSLGQDFSFQTNGTNHATPMSPTVAAASPGASARDHSKSNARKAARPVSMVGPAKSNEVSSTEAGPRRPLNTAARKPRPKSMIVGSAKVLETIAAQIDSPRERAKLRSAAATSSSTQTGPTTSRPGIAASTSQGPKATTTTQELKKPQPTVRTTKSAALRAAAHPKRAAPPAPAATSGLQKQRIVSAEVIADHISSWNSEDRKNAVQKIPVRSKSTKASNKPAVRGMGKRKVVTPEPKNTKDTKADSGTAQSYTPPGNPTRLSSPVKSPSKTRLTVLPATPATKPKIAPPLSHAAPSHAAKLRTPHPARTPVIQRTAGMGRNDGLEEDLNALRTPSKEIQSALDRAIDRKIEEDRRRGGWL
ncbi:hypothetical protein BU25DRAFT_452373 [Macroventuria anomochaeta]|uniref:Uncharacterized protein n=1 Tax=Macroventuria anomochaeta TaxID=301207 RepID=A0ACB6RJC3_9PLEO|nr:uncharacterized protein BU25DRAFT_452373 [Macroventuria anomochaeta]KAF2621976.1 hypothetical protein BU25DRAFT_452373 [Macroventuria anomochaeta]